MYSYCLYVNDKHIERSHAVGGVGWTGGGGERGGQVKGVTFDTIRYVRRDICMYLYLNVQ
jgi:hypothetical protein